MCNTDAQAFRNALGHREFLCPAQKSQILRVLLLLLLFVCLLLLFCAEKGCAGALVKRKRQQAENARGRSSSSMREKQIRGIARLVAKKSCLYFL
jgi:hypothetical protein